MGKYDRFDKYKEMQQKPGQKVHPIWGGIGCVMIILLPIVAYAAADTFFDGIYGSGVSLLGTTILPDTGIMYRVIYSLPLFGDTVRISPFHLVFMIAFTIIGFLIFSLVYAIVYRYTGPPKYGPMDSPPIRRSSKKRKR